MTRVKKILSVLELY